MNQENTETQTSTWAEEHPWLSQLTSTEDEDTVDEMIRFALDELRFA
jgi:hypothetical protein